MVRLLSPASTSSLFRFYSILPPSHSVSAVPLIYPNPHLQSPSLFPSSPRSQTVSHLCLSAVLFIFSPSDLLSFCGLFALVLVSLVSPPLRMACLIYPLSRFVPSQSLLSLISPLSLYPIPILRSAFSISLATFLPLPSLLPFLLCPAYLSLCVAFHPFTFLCLPSRALLFSPVYLFFQPLHSLQPLLLPLYCSMTTSLVSLHCLVLLSAPSLFSTYSLFSVFLSQGALSAPSLFSTYSLFSVFLSQGALFTPSALHTCYSHLSLSLSLPLHSISFLSCLFPSLTLSLSSLLSVPRLLFCTPLFPLSPHVHSTLLFLFASCVTSSLSMRHVPSLSTLSPLALLFRHSPCLIATSIDARISHTK